MLSEEEEVARIMRAAEARRKEREREHASKVAGAPKHQLMQKEHTGEERESEQGDEDVVTLDDSDVRWGEGAG